MILFNNTDSTKMFVAIFSLVVFVFLFALPSYGQSTPLQRDCPRFYNTFVENESSPCVWCTQIYFSPTEEILISSKNNTILTRRIGEPHFTKTSPDLLFTKTSSNLSYPHSIIFNPTDRQYYLNDTDNNRILIFSSLTQGVVEKIITKIAGINLIRPHDILYDPATEWMYTITPTQPTIFRFDHTGTKESFLDLSDVLSYSRSLSLIDGKIYVAGSSYGKIVEILDFEKGKINIYQSAGKKKAAYTGNWQTTGLIINDVDYFQNYWYVSSYFTPSAPKSNRDYNRNKLIRFKTWQDFETGSWQDLSDQIPDGLVPYYLTIANDKLYIALINHDHPGQGGTIYKLSTQCP